MRRGAAATLAGILAVAGAYFVAGRLALLMAIPPGYATAVWPAAGIALGAVLLYGPRVSPGILLGSCLVNLGPTIETSSTGAALASLGLAAAIGLGPMLQALAAAALVRRFVGFPTTLGREAEIWKLQLLAGPLSCVVSATLGIGLLAAAGILSRSQLAVSWGTWWVGDTIGVLLAAPLVLIWRAEPREVWRGRRRSVAVPLALCAALVSALFIYGSAKERQLVRSELRLRAERIADAMKADLASYVEVVRSIADAIEIDEVMERGEFQRLVARPLARYPGIAALSWNPLVQERVPVSFIEPLEPNRGALGFDLMSDPARREALDRARRTGGPVVSSQLELIQSAAAGPAVLILAPVMHAGAPTGTADVQGFAVAALRVLDAVRTSLRGLDPSGIDLQLAEAPAAPAAPAPILCSLRSGAPAAFELAGELVLERGFPFGDRRWVLRFAPSPQVVSAQRSWQAWTIFALGLLFTSLLGAFLLVVTGRTAAVDRLVGEQTGQLTQREGELREIIREKEVLIQEVHHRVKNNLQVVSSLISLQVRELESGARTDQRDALRECHGRVQAIALVHEKLYQTGSYADVPFASYARSLADSVFEANGASRSRIELHVAIDELDLSVDKAVPCALILNELISNALKHAFPGGRRGAIRVELSRAPGGACLVVADDGEGLPPGPDPRAGKSLGMQLVSTLTRQLHGRLEIASGPGVTVRVTFPLDGAGATAARPGSPVS